MERGRYAAEQPGRTRTYEGLKLLLPVSALPGAIGRTRTYEGLKLSVVG